MKKIASVLGALLILAGALAGCGNGYAVDAAAAPANARVGEAGTPSWLGLAPEVPEADITPDVLAKATASLA